MHLSVALKVAGSGHPSGPCTSPCIKKLLANLENQKRSEVVPGSPFHPVGLNLICVIFDDEDCCKIVFIHFVFAGTRKQITEIILDLLIFDPDFPDIDESALFARLAAGWPPASP